MLYMSDALAAELPNHSALNLAYSARESFSTRSAEACGGSITCASGFWLLRLRPLLSAQHHGAMKVTDLLQGHSRSVEKMKMLISRS